MEAYSSSNAARDTEEDKFNKVAKKLHLPRLVGCLAPSFDCGFITLFARACAVGASLVLRGCACFDIGTNFFLNHFRYK